MARNFNVPLSQPSLSPFSSPSSMFKLYFCFTTQWFFKTEVCLWRVGTVAIFPLKIVGYRWNMTLCPNGFMTSHLHWPMLKLFPVNTICIRILKKCARNICIFQETYFECVADHAYHRNFNGKLKITKSVFLWLTWIIKCPTLIPVQDRQEKHQTMTGSETAGFVL